ncbi:hypothetical protein MKX03_021368 [Papaver bracteatum]|nr:hypothetical protein MKX03_021368 [Papaver bracteatum]
MAHHHSTSGLLGKLVTEMEVNCNADNYYQIFKQHEDVPKAIPHLFTSMKVLEGHGLTSGCIKEWHYLHEGKALIFKENTTYNDEERTICHSVIGGDLLNDYKNFSATLLVKVKPMGHGKTYLAPPAQPAPQQHFSQPAQPASKHHHFSLHRPHVSQPAQPDSKHHFSLHRPHLNLCKTISHCPLTGRVLDMQDFPPPAPTYVAPPVPTYVAPPMHGSTVMWIIDYEKINKDSPIPVPYLAFFHQIIVDLNSHFCASY